MGQIARSMKDFDIEAYKNGWYTAKVDITRHHVNDTKSVIFDEIYAWIEKNIHGHRKHCVLTFLVQPVTEDTEKVYLVAKFRHEKDYELFVLRWV